MPICACGVCMRCPCLAMASRPPSQFKITFCTARPRSGWSEAPALHVIVQHLHAVLAWVACTCTGAQHTWLGSARMSRSPTTQRRMPAVVWAHAGRLQPLPASPRASRAAHPASPVGRRGRRTRASALCRCTRRCAHTGRPALHPRCYCGCCSPAPRRGRPATP